MRDKPDGRERREGRTRDRGRERVDDHDDRDGGDLREHLRAVETLATDTAHLASTFAFRFGGYTAQKGLVYFVSGDLKERLSRRWTDWKRTASLEPSQRPTAKPRPWKLQIYDALVEWVVGAVANGPTGADGGTIAGLLETITGGGVSVEAANHGDPLDGKPWPVIITYRGSEDSQKGRGCLARRGASQVPWPWQGVGGSAGPVLAWWGAQTLRRCTSSS